SCFPSCPRRRRRVCWSKSSNNWIRSHQRRRRIDPELEELMTGYFMKLRTKHLSSIACAVAIAIAMLVVNVQAQQVPIPQTAAEVLGPAPGPMTKAYVQMVGRMAYLWGWPLVYVHNQRTELTKAPEPILINGVLPLAPMNTVVMLTNYIAPAERYIGDPNQDVVYGLGYLSLEKEPVVIQVPDFGDRFWTLPVYDARTDQISELGLQYGTKPGFYIVVGPNWKGAAPNGIAGVVRSTTDFAVTMPRIFMNDTPEDRAAIQPALSQIQFYPLSQFDGKMKTRDWNKLPSFPASKAKTAHVGQPMGQPSDFFQRAADGHEASAPDARGRGTLQVDRQRNRCGREGAGSDEDAACDCHGSRQGDDLPIDAVALQWPARGQRMDITGQQCRIRHGLLSPHWRRAGRSLRQQAQRDDVFLHRRRLGIEAARRQVVLFSHLRERPAPTSEG